MQEVNRRHQAPVTIFWASLVPQPLAVLADSALHLDQPAWLTAVRMLFFAVTLIAVTTIVVARLKARRRPQKPNG